MKHGSLAAALIGAALFATASLHGAQAEEAKPVIHVTKTPTCGCCALWSERARAAGYPVIETDMADYIAMKEAHGVPPKLRACHSARVGGYVVEGHMPMEALAKLLSDRPDIVGISVPGMPAGSPGMGDDPSARYSVYAWTKEGGQDRATVFYEAGR